jgi:hypothetical protein
VGSALNQSLPVNSTDRTRVLLGLDGATYGRGDHAVAVYRPA